MKWNCVYRIREPKGVPPGDYPFHLFVVVGSLDDVKQTLLKLHAEFRDP